MKSLCVKHADQIVVLEQGKIVEVGSPRDSRQSTPMDDLLGESVISVFDIIVFYTLMVVKYPV